MPEFEGALERWSAQIVDAVTQAHRLVDARILLDGEGRRHGSVENAQLAGQDLHLAGRKIRVHRLVGATLNGAAREQHELGPQRLAAKVCFAGNVRSEDHLDETGAVTEIDEDHPSVIAAPVHPAGHHHLVTDER